MRTPVLLGGAAAVAGAAVGTMAGFRVPPRDPGPADGKGEAGAMLVGRAAVPGGLPQAVERFFRAAYGDTVPVTPTVSLWGRARMRLGSLWVHATMRNHHDLGQACALRFAATWYGRPVVGVTEGYTPQGGYTLLAGRFRAAPEIDEAAAQLMWSEAALFPYATIAQPAARWEAAGHPHEARLTVPAGPSGTASAVMSFDPGSGYPTALRADRFRTARRRVGWTVAYRGWRRRGELLTPTRATVTWDDESGPWLKASIEGAAVGLHEPFGPLETARGAGRP